jgi:hypothetical protein
MKKTNKLVEFTDSGEAIEHTYNIDSRTAFQYTHGKAKTKWIPGVFKPRIEKPKLNIKRKYEGMNLRQIDLDNQKELHKLTNELVEWAKKDSSVILQDFFLEKKLSPYKTYKFIKEHPELPLHEAFQYAKSACYTRMIKAQSPINPHHVTRLMPLYDSFFGDYLEEQQEKTNAQQKGNTIINAIMPDFPDPAPHVPPKNLFEGC